MKNNMKKIEASSLSEASSWLGASYIDSPEALNFMTADTLTDDRDIMSPSPPSRQRLKDALDTCLDNAASLIRPRHRVVVEREHLRLEQWAEL